MNQTKKRKKKRERITCDYAIEKALIFFSNTLNRKEEKKLKLILEFESWLI